MIATKHDFDALDRLLHEFEERVPFVDSADEMKRRVEGTAEISNLTTGEVSVYSLTTSGWQRIIT